MRENIEAYALGTLGAIKGVYEIYKPTNTQEKIETAALAFTVGSLAIAGATIIKSALTNKH